MDMTFEKYLLAYAGQDYRNRKPIRVDILTETADAEWTITEFKKILDGVPAHLHDEVKVNLVDEGFGDASVYLRIVYYRPETDEEWRKRVSTVEANARLAYDKVVEQAEAKDLAEYERLKKKFEGK